MNGRFHNMAEVRHDKCPAPNDYFDWLVLMQQYSLPTRLLDSSESPLVALIFALEESSKEERDAAVWAIEPMKWNLQ